MTTFIRAWTLLLIAGLGFALAGCGNKEAEQRGAFIQFLQTRVLDKPGRAGAQADGRAEGRVRRVCAGTAQAAGDGEG